MRLSETSKAVCGEVEKNDSHTFEGDKVATNHAGETYLKKQKEANCKEEGYTGDTHCKDCDAKIEDGRVIDKSAHNPASVWSHDDAKHWKECSNVVGCGVKLSEGAHTSTGENVATCQHKAVCDVCTVQYGDVAKHNYSLTWSNDATNHWHKCTGCGDKKDVAAHTPDHKGSATEEYAIKCTECGYILTPALGTPTDPTTPEKSDNKIDVPHTGDNSMIGLCIALLIVSGFGVAGTMVFYRKRKSVR